MADSVQYALDRMVVDLDDLRHRGIFTEAEVRAIISKRRDFEYLLRRHEARKLDYMRYAEHELHLESLRALRAKRLEGSRRGRKKKRAKGSSGAASDYTCVRLVRSILDRAVTKFPGDVDLWLHFIDFSARQGQSKALGRLFARALQLHPRNPGLWIKAASWEFFDAGNASSARALMQRALRINPTSRNLWLQYFRLEFSYVQKLTGRREVLGLDEEADDGPIAREDTREDMDIPPLEAEAEAEAGESPRFKAIENASAKMAPASASARPKTIMNEVARSFYKGAVPLAVFRAAIKELPDDVAFRGDFLRCCAVDFPDLGADVAEAILSSIAEDFPKDCTAWEVRATYPLLRSAKRTDFEKSMKIFEEAVKAIGESEPEVWVRYASCLLGVLKAGDVVEETRADQSEVIGDGGEPMSKKSKSSQAPGLPTGKVSKAAITAPEVVVKRLHQVLMRAVETHLHVRQEAAQQGRYPPVLSDEHKWEAREALSAGLADVCLALGEHRLAVDALRAATVCMPRRPGPWRRLATLERRVAALSPGGDTNSDLLRSGTNKRAKSGGLPDGGAIATLRTGLKRVATGHPEYPSLWRELLASMLSAGTGVDATAEAFRQAVTACSPRQCDAQGEFLAGYLRWVGAAQGVEAARSVMQWATRAFVLTSPGAVAAYRQAIEIERMQGTKDCKAKNRVQQLFEVCKEESISYPPFLDAVTKFGKSNTDLWEEYARFETQEGDLALANLVRRRAQHQMWP